MPALATYMASLGTPLKGQPGDPPARPTWGPLPGQPGDTPTWPAWGHPCMASLGTPASAVFPLLPACSLSHTVWAVVGFLMLHKNRTDSNQLRERGLADGSPVPVTVHA